MNSCKVFVLLVCFVLAASVAKIAASEGNGNDRSIVFEQIQEESLRADVITSGSGTTESSEASSSMATTDAASSSSSADSATTGSSASSDSPTTVSSVSSSSSTSNYQSSQHSSSAVSVTGTTQAPTVITVLEVTSVLDANGIEKQMQTQFESLFTTFCKGTYASQCTPYLASTFRQSRRAIYADCYDVNIPFSTAASAANGKTLYVAVGFLCGEIELLFIPSNLLVPFFTQNNASFDSISISGAYSSASVTSSAAVTSPSVIYQTVESEAYKIATICLGVFSGLLLIALIGYILYVHAQKQKNIAPNETELPVSSKNTTAYPQTSGNTKGNENDYSSADL